MYCVRHAKVKYAAAKAGWRKSKQLPIDCLMYMIKISSLFSSNLNVKEALEYYQSVLNICYTRPVLKFVNYSVWTCDT